MKSSIVVDPGGSAESVSTQGTIGTLAISDCIVRADTVACSILGAEPAQLRGRPLEDIVSRAFSLATEGGSSRQSLQERITAALAGIPQTFVIECSAAPGRPVWCLADLRRAASGGELLLRLQQMLVTPRGSAMAVDTGFNAQRIFDQASEMIYLRDAHGRFTFANQALLRSLDLQPEQLIGRTEAEVFDGIDTADYRSWANDAEALQSGAARQFEETLTQRKRKRTLLAIKLPVFSPSGDIGSLISIGIDISDRKLVESAMQHVALSITSVQGENVLRELVRYVCVSLRVDFALVGRIRDDAVETLAASDRGVDVANFAYDLAGTPCETVVGCEFRMVADDLLNQYPGDTLLQRYGYRSYAGIPLFDSAGKPIGILAVLHRRPMQRPELVASVLKIYSVRAAAELERLRAETALREAEASYRAIFEAAEDPIFVHDWDSGAILDVNEKACQSYGFSRDQLMHVTIDDISSGVPPYSGEDALKWIERAKAEGSVCFEWHRRSADGSLRWDEVRLKSAMIGGRPRVLAFTRDITERKAAEDALRASEEQYRSIFNASTDGQLLFSRSGRVISVNPTFARMVGCSVDEVMRAPPGSFVAEQSGESLRELMEAVAAGLSFEGEGYAQHCDGHLIPVNVRSVPVVYRGEDHQLAIVRDISRRIAQQQQLVRSEQRLRATVESSLDCIIAIDLDGRIIEFNPAAEATFGIAASDAMGQDMSSLLIPERFRAAHNAGMARFLETGGGAFLGRRVEVVAQRANGAEFDAELVISPSESAEGRIVIGFLRDVTEQKAAQAERERLEAQLRQAQKMEAIGHLAGGIAHDFNNILTSLTGYVAMAQEHLESVGEEKAGRYLGKSLQSAERARNLIQQLLVFSRGQRGEPVAVSLDRHLGEFVGLLRSTLPTSIDFETEYEADLPAVMVDPTQLDQVLMNLCINARDAMQAQGHLRVSVRRRRCRNSVCASCRKGVTGEFIELAVEDTGHGIEPAVLERIFDPFFTTKIGGKGTGMGLSTTHGIVHDYGGHIIVDTARDRGTVFRVLLPYPETTAAAPAPEPARTTVRSAPELSGSVLLVDDDPQVLEFMHELLMDWGLDVHAFGDPLAALRSVSLGDAVFDLAILDHTMPALSGLQLARRLAELRPCPRILIYTGYSDPISDEEVEQSGISALLHKPIDNEHLLAVLRENLPN